MRLSLASFRLKAIAPYPVCGGEAFIAKTLFREEYGAFAEQLRKMRLDANLTQEGLAVKMNVSQRFVSRCESRERRVDFFELLDWCEATDVRLADFLTNLKSVISHRSLDESQERALHKILPGRESRISS